MFYNLEVLQREDVPAGVDTTRKEDYLSDEDFQRVLGMGREQWAKTKLWRRTNLKNKAGIFSSE